MTLITSGLVSGRCTVCGKDHATCGEPSTSVPVDQNLEEAAMGGPLTVYDVLTPNGVETRMKLNQADAERYENDGFVLTETAKPKPEAKAAKAPKNKAATAKNKSDGGSARD